MAKQLGSSGKARPNAGASSSSRSNPAARAGQRKAAPARSNAGGAVRGQARAAQVKAMNKSKPKPNRKTPISMIRQGKKTSITGSRSVDAQAIRRGKAASAAAAKPKAAGVGAPSAAPKAQLQDYAGNPAKFLGDFFSGGVFRKR